MILENKQAILQNTKYKKTKLVLAVQTVWTEQLNLFLLKKRTLRSLK